MILNTDKIDRAVHGMLPWDFQVVVDGQTYATEPLTVAQMGQIHAALSSANQEQLIGLGQDLFRPVADAGAGDGPAAVAPVQHWHTEKLIAAISGVIEYFQVVTQKNFEGLSAWVKAEMAKNGPRRPETSISSSSSRRS